MEDDRSIWCKYCEEPGVCGALSPTGGQHCTRGPKHDGLHVACGVYTHELEIWEDGMKMYRIWFKEDDSLRFGVVGAKYEFPQLVLVKFSNDGFSLEVTEQNAHQVGKCLAIFGFIKREQYNLSLSTLVAYLKEKGFLRTALPGLIDSSIERLEKELAELKAAVTA